jgi:hypothetical protein
MTSQWALYSLEKCSAWHLAGRRGAAERPKAQRIVEILRIGSRQQSDDQKMSSRYPQPLGHPCGHPGASRGGYYAAESSEIGKKRRCLFRSRLLFELGIRQICTRLALFTNVPEAPMEMTAPWLLDESDAHNYNIYSCSAEVASCRKSTGSPKKRSLTWPTPSYQHQQPPPFWRLYQRGALWGAANRQKQQKRSAANRTRGLSPSVHS